LDTVEKRGGRKQVTISSQVFEFLARHIDDPDTHWSLGAFGAIAEFMRDRNEPTALVCSATSLSATTGRGGIRITPLAAMRPIASETAVGEGWNHRVALCLPREHCAMSRRSVLTEIGPDVEALSEQHQDNVLFDLGLDCLQIDCCIRPSDPDVTARLRTYAGRSLFEPGNQAMAMILAANPHRVFVSRLGRVEVFQPIPPADGRSPQGPHTHVLPKLLSHGRTHAATEPIPKDLVPCAHLYPSHPSKDAMGRPRPFDVKRHEAFQILFETYGNPELVALKRRVTAAVVAGEEPALAAIADGRFGRGSVRVALRQLRAAGTSLPTLAAWLAVHENGVHVAPEDDSAESGH
jgi:hypothetical protein